MKKAPELSAIEVKRKSKKPGKHAVGGVNGLYLVVSKPPESKSKREYEGVLAASWVLRKMVGADRREFGLGSYPQVGLEAARDLAREYGAMITGGVDPVADKERKAAVLRAAQAKRLTFDEAVERYVPIRTAGLRNAKNKLQWASTLKVYASPVIGSLALERFDTKIAVLLRDDLATWQRLNVTAFLASGVADEWPQRSGSPTRTPTRRRTSRCWGSRCIVLEADAAMLRAAHERALRRDLTVGVFTADLFRTGNDDDNRAAVAAVGAPTWTWSGWPCTGRGTPSTRWSRAPGCTPRRPQPSTSGRRSTTAVVPSR